MSIGLLLEYPGTDQQTHMVPIATEQTFEAYWLPASKLLELQWLPIFQSGLPVSKEDIPYILGELKMLKHFMTSDPPPQLPKDMAEHVVERINRLCAELILIQDIPNVKAYIG